MRPAFNLLQTSGERGMPEKRLQEIEGMQTIQGPRRHDQRHPRRLPSGEVVFRFI